MAEEGFVWLSFAFFAYFVFYTVTTFGLICRSLYETVLTGVERGTLFTPPERQHRPGISLIAPAYNMAPVIAASARMDRRTKRPRRSTPSSTWSNCPSATG
jgi:hypothetical protein